MNNFELRIYYKIRDDSVVARVFDEVELQRVPCGYIAHLKPRPVDNWNLRIPYE